jgi:hypothetical protein
MRQIFEDEMADYKEQIAIEHYEKREAHRLADAHIRMLSHPWEHISPDQEEKDDDTNN